MRYFSICILVLIAPAIATAQESTTTALKPRITGASIYSGFSISPVHIAPLSDFKKLAPSSKLLSHDLSGFSEGGFYLRSSNNIFSGNLTLLFPDAGKTSYRERMQLRVGFMYFAGDVLSNTFNKTVSKPYDTLYSAQTGNETYLDSVISTTYNMNHRSEQLRLDASLIFTTNPAARWSLFGGIGLTAGYAVSAETHISYHSNRRTEALNSSNYVSYHSSEIHNVQEQFKSKGGAGFSAYVPVGLDFRIGKKRDFWKRLHLYYEARPSLDYSSVPGIFSGWRGNLQHGLGARITLDQPSKS